MFFLGLPTIQTLISEITSPELQERLFLLRIVFVFFFVFFLITVLYFLAKSSFIQSHFWYDVIEFFAWQPYGFLKIIKRWKKIKERIESKTESEYKLAIIEADDFLNEILENKGYKGESFEERVEKVPKSEIPDKEEAKKIHETRNSVVHDPDFKLDEGRAKEIIDNYEKIIKNLGML